MAIVFPLKFPNIFGGSPEAESNPTQGRKEEGGSKRVCGPGLLTGFPFINHGQDRYKIPSALTIPRLKYTWFAELQVNEAYLKSNRLSTNIDHFLENDNRIYLNLKRIDHPKPNVPTETLRSYNKYVKVQTKVEYPPAQMTFDDDATSIIMALWKEYFAFYSHAGDIGFQLLLGTDLVSTTREDVMLAIDQNIATHGYGHLVSSGGTEPRASMDIRPSIGMRLKPNAFRHFFDQIIIYDLGTEPDSVNVYYYYRPVITAFDHGDLDWEDRTGKVETNVTFEYENYYFALGKQRWTVRDVIKRMTGQDVPIVTNQQKVELSHGDMRVPEFPKVPQGTVDPPQPIFEDPRSASSALLFDEDAEPPRSTTEIQEDLRDVERTWQRILSDRCSSARDSKECLQQQRAYETETARLESELNQSRQFEQEKTSFERGNESTQDALRNTEEANETQVETQSTTSAVRTEAQTAALEVQLNRVTNTRTKLDNTITAEQNTVDALKEALEKSDRAELTGEQEDGTFSNPSGQFTKTQYQEVKAAIRTGEFRIAQTEKERDLVAAEEQKLQNILGK